MLRQVCLSIARTRLATSGKQFQVCNGDLFLTLNQGKALARGPAKKFKDTQAGLRAAFLPHSQVKEGTQVSISSTSPFPEANAPGC